MNLLYWIFFICLVLIHFSTLCSPNNLKENHMTRINHCSRMYKMESLHETKIMYLQISTSELKNLQHL